MKLKVCVVSSTKPYPAFDSVLSICREVKGPQNVTDFRFNADEKDYPALLKPLFILLADFCLFLKLVKIKKEKKINVMLLFQGYWPLTSLGSRLLGTKLILYVGGSGFEWSFIENTSSNCKIIVYLNLLIEKICHASSNVIVTLSPRMVGMLKAGKFRNKTMFALPRLDSNFLSEFKITQKIDQRKNMIGYVGALNIRKGIMNLIRAIPFVLQKRDCHFIIVGDGPLMGDITKIIKDLKINNSVTLTGYADYNLLSGYFNEMKLCIIPSYAEGIPSTIFEAMACGTPVLSTPVGGILDVVTDHKTGFILPSNSPRSIADQIIRLIDDPKTLKEVSNNAVLNFTHDFSKEKIDQSWKNIFVRIESPTQ